MKGQVAQLVTTTSSSQGSYQDSPVLNIKLETTKTTGKRKLKNKVFN